MQLLPSKFQIDDQAYNAKLPQNRNPVTIIGVTFRKSRGCGLFDDLSASYDVQLNNDPGGLRFNIPEEELTPVGRVA